MRSPTVFQLCRSSAKSASAVAVGLRGAGVATGCSAACLGLPRLRLRRLRAGGRRHDGPAQDGGQQQAAAEDGGGEDEAVSRCGGVLPRSVVSHVRLRECGDLDGRGVLEGFTAADRPAVPAGARRTAP